MATTATRPALNYIGGVWMESTSREHVRDVNPARSTKSLGDATGSRPEDVVQAIDAATAAYQEWRRTPAPQRGDMVRKAADLMEQRRVELARLLTQEEGKTLAESLAEVDRAVANVRFAAGQGARLNGETIPSTQRGTFIYTVRDPLGVVACITPWNFSVAIPAWKIAPALVAGNAVVFKPATLTPLCAAQVVQCFVDAGVPEGVLNMVLGPGDALSRAIVDDERVRAISFTGSNAVGRRLYAQAAKRLCKVQLEMGGKNAVIVMDDADLEKAAESVAGGAFGATGQRCTATSRAVVMRSRLVDFTELLAAKADTWRAGDGLADGVRLGPIVDDIQLRKVRDRIEAGEGEGARTVRGGRAPSKTDLKAGSFVHPTTFPGDCPSTNAGPQENFG